MQGPSNIEAEQAVLGSLLSDSGLTNWPQVSGLLAPDHFAEPIHSRMFNAIATLCSAGQSATPLTLKSAFEKDETLQEIGGFVYLARLMASAVPLLSLRPHAELLRNLAARRVVIEAAHKLITDADTVTINETFRPTLAAHVRPCRRSLTMVQPARPPTQSAKQCRRWPSAQQLKKRRIPRNAIKTGIAAFDRFTGGLLGETLHSRRQTFHGQDSARLPVDLQCGGTWRWCFLCQPMRCPFTF